MMRIVSPSEFKTTPWKNGGGITHEIASQEDQSGMLWRLSLAEVARDGPFSTFPGLARILTVVEGEGMALHGACESRAACPMKPVRFSGEDPIRGQLTKGPVRNFNLIYDPSSIAASVERLSPRQIYPLAGQPGRDHVLYCVVGRVGFPSAPDLREGSCAFLEQEVTSFEVPAGAQVLLVILDGEAEALA